MGTSVRHRLPGNVCVCGGGGFNKCIDIEHVVYAGSGYIKYKFAQKTNIIYSHTLLAAAG